MKIFRIINIYILQITTTVTSGASTSLSSTIAPQTNDVGVNISWTYTNGITAVKMIVNNLKISQWLAMGLSLDDSMVLNLFYILQNNIFLFYIGRRSCIYLSTFS
jgi:hypothetical protein